ncbi:transposase family protein [Streptomyces rubiginosohelvolus]|uniref:transposase family protein n=1 Tax=Streptomyces rubiginosohelvolus TaxID=67362 RepID=UPI0036688941
MLVSPSSIDLSSRILRFFTGQLTAKRRKIGARWRRLPASRQALLALAHLRCGDTYAQLAAGFGIGIATVYRYIREAVEALSAIAPSLAEVMRTIRSKACWADKAYQGAGGPVRMPFRGRRLKRWKRRHNTTHAKIRCLGEQAMATLERWRLLRKLRCSTNRVTDVV